MLINFKANYPLTENKKNKNPQKIDGAVSHLKISPQKPQKQTPKKSNELLKKVFIFSATIPILLTGGYLSAIRGFEKKFFTDGARSSKKYFRPIISELKGKIAKVNIKTEDNLLLDCWDINPQNFKKYVLVCHGNGQNLNDCQELYNNINKKGYGVFALEYRGYGNNKGHVFEKGLYKDADAALKYIKSKGISEDKIGVVGYSLGGAVATDLSSRNSLAFTILTSTFNNARELSKNSVNYLELKLSDKTKKQIDKFPEKLIPMKNNYRSDQKIDKINGPIVMIHSQDDKGIPISLAQKLAQKAKNSSSLNFITLDAGDHWLDDKKIRTICESLDKFYL